MIETTYTKNAVNVSSNVLDVVGVMIEGVQYFYLEIIRKMRLLWDMPRETVIIECTEARKEGKPVSRYMTTRNKKLQTEKVEKMKYNPFLRRRTLHKEIKG